MATVLLVVHLMIAAGLVGVVLLQRSEGGALGIGGGGGGGFMTGRGTANLLTRVTAGLAAAFFVTSLALTVLAKQTTSSGPIVGRGTTSAPVSTSPVAPETPAVPAAPGTASAPAAPAGTPAGTTAPRGGILDKLPGGSAPVPPSK